MIGNAIRSAAAALIVLLGVVACPREAEAQIYCPQSTFGTYGVTPTAGQWWVCLNFLQSSVQSTNPLTALPTGDIFIGNLSGRPAAQAVSGDATLSALGALTVTKTNGVPLTAAATTPLGTSGASLCLLSANCTFSGTDNFTGTFEIGGVSVALPISAANGGSGEAGTVTGALKGNGASAYTQATCADLSNGASGCSTAVGTAATVNTGTSGHALGFLDGNNTSSGNQTHSGTENFTGPIEIGGTVVTLPVPVAIGGTGAGNASDALQNISGVLNASSCGYAQAPSWCAGSDIGAWVNAAIARSVSQGWTRPKIVLDPTRAYALTTTIVTPLNVILDGQGAKITRAATSGAALVIGTATGSCSFCWFNVGGVYNLVLQGPGYTSGHTDIGIYMGGDPAGVISPSTDFAGDALISNVQVKGFSTGITYGNNTWQVMIKDSTIDFNNDGIATPATAASNAGELMKVLNTNVSNNSNCGFNLLIQDEWAMYGGALDYNTVAQVCGVKGWLDLFSVHLEYYTGPLVTFTGPSTFRMFGGSMVLVSGSGSENGIINQTATDITHSNFSLQNVLVSTAHSVPYVVYTAGLASVNLCTNNVYFAYSPFLPAMTDATTNWCQAGNLTPSSLSVGIDEQRIAPPTNGIRNEGTFYEIGNIGIGTATPAFRMHIRQNTASTDVASVTQNDDTGNAAFFRAVANSNYVNFQSYGSGQNWVAGENGATGWVLFDATNSLTPFYVAPGSLANSIHVTSSGVGILNANPSVALDVTGTEHVSGTVQAATINDTGLTASLPVCSDGSKNLSSTCAGLVPVADLANVGGGTVLGNATASSAAVTATSTPVLGVNATTTGTIGLANGAGSGATTTVQPSVAVTSAITVTAPYQTGTVSEAAACSVATGATVDLGATCSPGAIVTLTGTGNTITAFGSSAPVGARYTVIVPNTTTITSSGTLNLPRGVSLSTSTNPLHLECYEPTVAGTWFCTLPLYGGNVSISPAGTIATNGTVSAATVTDTGLTASTPVYTDASKNLTSTAPAGYSAVLSGTTGSIGGGALLAGACSSGTATVTGATTSMVALVDPSTYPGDGAYWDGYISSANTVTVKVCATVALTPTASTYNVRVLQ